MADISRVYRFDKELARNILETAKSCSESGRISTAEMTRTEPFDTYPYEAVVANCLYLWNDACIHLQTGDEVDDTPEGQTNYYILGLTGIGKDRLRTFDSRST